MRIDVYPQDKNGCGHYRLAWPAMALSALGYDVRVRTTKPQIITDNQNNVVALAEARLPDVVVIQRPCRKQWVQFVKAAQNQGVRVVIDFDDDLSAIHPLNMAYKLYHTAEMNAEFGMESCDAADWVVCSTPALTEKFGVGHNSVVPNHIPAKFLYMDADAKRNPEYVTVGWAGRTETHPADLQITHGAINEALVRSVKNGVPARFLALGDARTLYNLNVRDRLPNDVRPGVAFPDYSAMVCELDIGIVPLEDSEFNTAKSWLKGLEYASLGIAPVVTPTPDNLRLIEAGAAWSASSPREWKEKVQTLIEDTDERESLAKAAKEFAADWTIEANAWKWYEAWTGQPLPAKP